MHTAHNEYFSSIYEQALAHSAFADASHCDDVLLWGIEIFLWCSDLSVAVFAERRWRIQLLRSIVHGRICVGCLRQVIDDQSLIIVCVRLLLMIGWEVRWWRWCRCGDKIWWCICGQFLCVCRWGGSVVVLLCLRIVLNRRIEGRRQELFMKLF